MDNSDKNVKLKIQFNIAYFNPENAMLVVN